MPAAPIAHHTFPGMSRLPGIPIVLMRKFQLAGRSRGSSRSQPEFPFPTPSSARDPLTMPPGTTDAGAAFTWKQMPLILPVSVRTPHSGPHSGRNGCTFSSQCVHNVSLFFPQCIRAM
jgi:hypothetical protein